MNRSDAWSLLQIRRGLADVRCARRDVDKPRNLLVLSGLRNDRATVVVADEDHGIRLMVERPHDGVDIYGATEFRLGVRSARRPDAARPRLPAGRSRAAVGHAVEHAPLKTLSHQSERPIRLADRGETARPEGVVLATSPAPLCGRLAHPRAYQSFVFETIERGVNSVDGDRTSGTLLDLTLN